MNRAGKFITLEGGEGSGKSTLLHQLKSWFELKGHPALFTREPGGTHLGEEVRSLVLEKREAPISSRAETLLFLAARAQHVHEKIEPALNSGVSVICDRFSDSTIAYQGYARGLNVDEILELTRFATAGLEPDLTLILDIDPIIGLKRAKSTVKEEKSDRMEAEEVVFHQKVRAAFRGLSKKFPRRIRLLDAEAPPEKVFEQAVGYIEDVLRTS